MKQTTNSILMIRPINFRMNEQTAVNNYYQEELDLKNSEINKKAQQEFDAYVHTLKHHGVEVIVVSDTDEFDTPDSLFPNNWISFHEDGTVAFYDVRNLELLHNFRPHDHCLTSIFSNTSATSAATPEIELSSRERR